MGKRQKEGVGKDGTEIGWDKDKERRGTGKGRDRREGVGKGGYEAGTSGFAVSSFRVRSFFRCFIFTAFPSIREPVRNMSETELFCFIFLLSCPLLIMACHFV